MMTSRKHSGRSSNKTKKLSEKKAKLKNFLKEKGFKATRQREVIASEFLKTGEHVTAEELYQKISRKHKDIGFTTVYRTLKLLKKSGVATQRIFADKLIRYEALSSDDHHDHLICMNCGSITEFENPKIEKLQDKIADDFGFITITHKMELYGYCQHCRDSAQ